MTKRFFNDRDGSWIDFTPPAPGTATRQAFTSTGEILTIMPNGQLYDRRGKIGQLVGGNLTDEEIYSLIGKSI